MDELYGKYRLVKRIACGGMGEVFLARSRQAPGREGYRVVKRLFAHHNNDPELVRMFLDEARIGARLDHPNIVHIFELGKEGDTYYIAMELVDGVDLQRLWDAGMSIGRRMPLGLVARMAIDVAAGLEHTHKATDDNGSPLRIIHRDVSPGNVVVSLDGQVKIIDYGVAKAVGRFQTTQVGTIKGKYAYMSPEQVLAEPTDHRSDLFSLGIILYEFVARRRLFSRSSELDIMRAVAECAVVPPSMVAPDVPRALDGLLMPALARDPAARYPDAASLREAFEGWVRAEGLVCTAEELARYLREVVPNRSPIDLGVEPAAVERAATDARTTERGETANGPVCPQCGTQYAPREFLCRRCQAILDVGEVFATPKKERIPTLMEAMFGGAAADGGDTANEQKSEVRPLEKAFKRETTSSARFEMPPNAVLRTRDIDLTKYDLSSFEAFIVSLIEPRFSTDEICAASGLSDREFAAVVHSLVEKGVIEVQRPSETVEAATPAQPPSPVQQLAPEPAKVAAPPGGARAWASDRDPSRFARAIELARQERWEEVPGVLDPELASGLSPASTYNRLAIVVARYRHDFACAERLMQRALNQDPANPVYLQNLEQIRAMASVASDGLSTPPERPRL